MADEDEEASLRAQWKCLGADPDQAMQASAAGRLESEGHEGQGDYELPPEQWLAWEVFLACFTQWRISVGLGSERYEGIEYASLEVVMRLLQVKRKVQRDVFWMVRVMEDEARKWFNKR